MTSFPCASLGKDALSYALCETVPFVASRKEVCVGGMPLVVNWLATEDGVFGTHSDNSTVCSLSFGLPTDLRFVVATRRFGYLYHVLFLIATGGTWWRCREPLWREPLEV